MGRVCDMHVSECDLCLKERKESVDCTGSISAFSSKCTKDSENMPLGVFTQYEHAHVWVSLSICSCTAVLWVHVCVCAFVCVVGRADKQAVGWEVEGVHRLRLLTQFWQNAAPGAPRKSGWRGLSAAIWSPPSDVQRRKNTQRQAARDTALSILIARPAPFFFFFPVCNNQL